VPPIAEQTYPPLRDAGAPRPEDLMLITDLPAIRLDNVPPTAYVQVVFAESVRTLARRRPTWGMWLGGYDPPAIFGRRGVQTGAGRSGRAFSAWSAR
jgi:hypothetical protein